MLITRKRYEAMLDIINQQKKDIETLNNVIDNMKLESYRTEAKYNKAVNMVSSLVRFISSAKKGAEIEFPNSKEGGFEGSDIFDM